jgi:hydrogenase maturation protease
MLTLEPPAGVRPILVIAIGNPSRGDDALGPLLAERLEALDLPGVEVLTDFQLQVEHALDLLGRSEVVFVDAAAGGEGLFSFLPAETTACTSVTTHALSPAGVLDCCRRLTGDPVPRAMVLAIHGYRFELGEPLTRQARRNLDAAFDRLVARLRFHPVLSAPALTSLAAD